MSKLVYKGDSRVNFGQYLPTPCIDQVILEDNGWTLKFSMYLRVAEDEELNSVVEELRENIKVFVVLNVESGFAEGFKEAAAPEKIVEHMVTSNTFESSYSQLGYHFREIELPPSEWQIDDEIMYDEEGYRLLKYNAEYQELHNLK